MSDSTKRNRRWKSFRDQISQDTNPLDGVANLFDVAILFGLGILVAFLAAPADSMLRATPIDAERRETVSSGQGKFLGKAYQLEDGSIIYVPNSSQ